MIGAMKRRVTLRAPVLTADGAGGFSESWQDVATVYASIMPDAAGGQLKYGQIAATTTYKIVIRYRTDVTPGMILVDEEGVTYTIISATAQAGLKVYLEILSAVRA